jgi:hypothetical protein
MKISLLVAYIVLSLTLWVLTGCLAQNPTTPSATVDGSRKLQDLGYLFVTAEQIQDDLRRSPNNPLALYNVVRQAAHNGLELDAYSDLRKMVKNDPGNPYLLTAYCFSYGVASGDYDFNRYYNAFGNDSKYAGELEYYQNLAKAEKIAPNLWLIYLLKAQPAIYPGNGNRAEALAYLRKAVELAPDISYTHYALGHLLLAPNSSSPSDRTEGLREEAAAARLQPINAQAPWLLFEVYGFELHNREKGIAAKKLFLSEIPPDWKLSTGESGLLANYPK